MYMSDKLYSSELNPSEKLVLAYILTGHYRYKYVALDQFSKKLYLSEPSVSKTLKQLEQKELIKWVRVEGHKYKIIIVCQKAFNKYGFLNKGETINENKNITRDPVIITLGEIEANKTLMTFEKKKLTNDKSQVVPSWYGDYKEDKPKEEKEITKEEEEKIKELVKTMF